MDRVVDNITTKLSTEKAAQLDHRILNSEMLRVITDLPVYKTAVPNGLRARVFKASASIWANITTNVTIETRSIENSLPSCLTKSIIVLLHKNGSMDEVEIYPPKALVNVIANLVGGVSCIKIKSLLPGIIPVTQAWFVSERTERQWNAGIPPTLYETEVVGRGVCLSTCQPEMTCDGGIVI